MAPHQIKRAEMQIWPRVPDACAPSPLPPEYNVEPGHVAHEALAELGASRGAASTLTIRRDQANPTLYSGDRVCTDLGPESSAGEI